MRLSLVQKRRVTPDTKSFVFKAERVSSSARKAFFRCDSRKGEECRISDSAVPDLQAQRFYVSGPEPMVDSFGRTIKQLGIPESEIVNDFFAGYEWP